MVVIIVNQQVFGVYYVGSVIMVGVGVVEERIVVVGGAVGVVVGVVREV